MKFAVVCFILAMSAETLALPGIPQTMTCMSSLADPAVSISVENLDVHGVQASYITADQGYSEMNNCSVTNLSKASLVINGMRYSLLLPAAVVVKDGNCSNMTMQNIEDLSLSFQNDKVPALSLNLTLNDDGSANISTSTGENLVCATGKIQ